MTALFRSRAGVVLMAFLAIATFFLITEHRAHVFGVLPFAFLLACLFMHIFMHGGHGHDHGAHPGNETQPPDGGAK